MTASGSPATVEDVGGAVQACIAAVENGMPDRTRLQAAGWRVERTDKDLTYFAAAGNAARILLAPFPLGGVCIVRAALDEPAQAPLVSSEIDRLTGTAGRIRHNDGRAWQWRAGDLFLSLDPFDDGPGEPSNIVQILAGRLPREMK
jgi:hypothetical protein